MYVCTYVCMCVCMYVCIYHTHIHTHIHIHIYIYMIYAHRGLLHLVHDGPHHAPDMRIYNITYILYEYVTIFSPTILKQTNNGFQRQPLNFIPLKR